jgi:hypothetical protein
MAILNFKKRHFIQSKYFFDKKELLINFVIGLFSDVNTGGKF